MTTYSAGFQDGYTGQPQRQKRRPYATGYKWGKIAFELEVAEKRKELMEEWRKEAEFA